MTDWCVQESIVSAPDTDGATDHGKEHFHTVAVLDYSESVKLWSNE